MRSELLAHLAHILLQPAVDVKIVVLPRSFPPLVVNHVHHRQRGQRHRPHRLQLALQRLPLRERVRHLCKCLVSHGEKAVISVELIYLPVVVDKILENGARVMLFLMDCRIRLLATHRAAQPVPLHGRQQSLLLNGVPRLRFSISLPILQSLGSLENLRKIAKPLR